MKSEELISLGIPRGAALRQAQRAVGEALHQGKTTQEIRSILRILRAFPDKFLDDDVFGELAATLLQGTRADARDDHRRKPAPCKRWGQGIDPNAIAQIDNACRLPVSVAGALMPDAHVGYGLPIGGVLATRNTVIPYAVGVDIACRMKMTVLDLPARVLDEEEDRLRKAIEKETRFGIGAKFRKRRHHAVMDADWTVTKITHDLKDKAWSQLGTSGSGNHFVEFGTLDLQEEYHGLEPDVFLAVLSHSGSRGAGARVADFYSKLAVRKHPELSGESRHLAWLDMESAEGMEYWAAMTLMGSYAAANHALIHKHIAGHLGAEVLLDIENHHNFAWREQYEGREVIVHRKGATPAGKGVMGIIPGSMGDPGYVVRGRGNRLSLHSASHGAGRKMSRREAKRRFRWRETREYLKARGVKLISAGLDEVPMAYKDIDEVMAAQTDLVDVIAKFRPRLVKMAPAGERPED